jgi:hypothetical protein
VRCEDATTPKLRFEDGLVLAGVGRALANDFAAIDPVLEHQVECPAGEMLTTNQPSTGSLTALARNILSVEIGPEQRDGRVGDTAPSL